MGFRIRKFYILIDQIHVLYDTTVDIMRRITGSLDRHMERPRPLNRLMDKIRLRQWFAA